MGMSNIWDPLPHEPGCACHRDHNPAETSSHVAHEHMEHYGTWYPQGNPIAPSLFWRPTSTYILKHSHEGGGEKHEHRD